MGIIWGQRWRIFINCPKLVPCKPMLFQWSTVSKLHKHWHKTYHQLEMSKDHYLLCHEKRDWKYLGKTNRDSSPHCFRGLKDRLQLTQEQIINQLHIHFLVFSACWYTNYLMNVVSMCKFSTDGYLFLVGLWWSSNSDQLVVSVTQNIFCLLT